MAESVNGGGSNPGSNNLGQSPKEMSMEMRLLLAFLLMGAVMFVFQYLYPQTPPPAAKSAPAPVSPSSNVEGASAWPELDVSADSFVSKGKDLGRLELVAKPTRGQAGETPIERISASSAAS